ncbi:hypothetical protein ACFZC3_29470 [Streptomyces sp. NPDC007903]|uniref:hypothetical protein n=1 Tax=Streptomyces sp. NPDC007903 TaxID=3364786 RepID=UPI0036E1FF59
MSAAVLAVAAPTVLIGAAGSASAATTKCVYEGSDRACGTQNTSTSGTIQVCDNEADGNGVYGLLIGRKSGSQVRVGDSNGSATGCGTGTLNNDSIFVIRICEDDLGEDTCRGEYF